MSYCLPPTVMKSNFNFTCCMGCGKPIKRGQEVTFVSESRGMILRPVECINGIYIPSTGRRIVHKDCDVMGLWTDYGSNEDSKIKHNSNYDYCEIESDNESNYDLCDNKNNNKDINKEPIVKKGWLW